MTSLLLPPQPRQRSLWEQRLTETDSEYRQFLLWLGSVPRPAPAEPALASCQDWASRAEAYDRLHTLPESSGECLAETVDTLVRGALVQTRRWLEQQATTHEPVDVSQTVRVLEAVARLQEVASAGRPTQPRDFASMSDEDLWLIDEAARLLQGR